MSKKSDPPKRGRGRPPLTDLDRKLRHAAVDMIHWANRMDIVEARAAGEPVEGKATPSDEAAPRTAKEMAMSVHTVHSILRRTDKRPATVYPTQQKPEPAE